MLRALEDALLDFGGCAVVISHDRWFLDRIATHILAFEGDSRGRLVRRQLPDYEAQRHERLGIDADQPHRIKYKSLADSLSLSPPLLRFASAGSYSLRSAMRRSSLRCVGTSRTHRVRPAGPGRMAG